jgi:hypothetical protein
LHIQQAAKNAGQQAYTEKCKPGKIKERHPSPGSAGGLQRFLPEDGFVFDSVTTDRLATPWLHTSSDSPGVNVSG